jgi:hypothetical protein
MPTRAARAASALLLLSANTAASFAGKTPD